MPVSCPNPLSDPSDVSHREAPVLDAAALARLQELDPGGERGVVPMILSTFETALRRSRAEMAAQVGAADIRTVFGLAHTLKASSASIGALSLSALCTEIEALLRPAQGGAPAPAAVGATLDGELARLIAASDIALAQVGNALHG